MPKKLRTYSIYLAPKIRGVIKSDGRREIYDEKKNEYLDQESIDDKIKIYERQVREWFLERASRLQKGENNGFIILMICTSYIEGIQQYIDGEPSNGQSKAVFKKGLRRIFLLDVEERKLDEYYKHVRCGLFHTGMSGSPVIISEGYQQTIDFSDDETIKINPKRLLSEIKMDFKKYISILKDMSNETERDNFNNMFSE